MSLYTGVFPALQGSSPTQQSLTPHSSYTSSTSTEPTAGPSKLPYITGLQNLHFSLKALPHELEPPTRTPSPSGIDRANELQNKLESALKTGVYIGAFVNLVSTSLSGGDWRPKALKKSYSDTGSLIPPLVETEEEWIAWEESVKAAKEERRRYQKTPSLQDEVVSEAAPQVLPEPSILAESSQVDVAGRVETWRDQIVTSAEKESVREEEHAKTVTVAEATKEKRRDVEVRTLSFKVVKNSQEKEKPRPGKNIPSRRPTPSSAPQIAPQQRRTLSKSPAPRPTRALVEPSKPIIIDLSEQEDPLPTSNKSAQNVSEKEFPIEEPPSFSDCVTSTQREPVRVDIEPPAANKAPEIEPPVAEAIEPPPQPDPPSDLSESLQPKEPESAPPPDAETLPETVEEPQQVEEISTAGDEPELPDPPSFDNVITSTQVPPRPQTPEPDTRTVGSSRDYLSESPSFRNVPTSTQNNPDIPALLDNQNELNELPDHISFDDVIESTQQHHFASPFDHHSMHSMLGSPSFRSAVASTPQKSRSPPSDYLGLWEGPPRRSPTPPAEAVDAISQELLSMSSSRGNTPGNKSEIATTPRRKRSTSPDTRHTSPASSPNKRSKHNSPIPLDLMPNSAKPITKAQTLPTLGATERELPTLSQLLNGRHKRASTPPRRTSAQPRPPSPQPKKATPPPRQLPIFEITPIGPASPFSSPPSMHDDPDSPPTLGKPRFTRAADPPPYPRPLGTKTSSFYGMEYNSQFQIEDNVQAVTRFLEEDVSVWARDDD